MATAVVGMHRSGTSLVARLLNLAGLYLGREEELIPAGAFNERGFWEHRQLMDINDEILAAGGGSWSFPPIPGSCWQAAPALRPVREKACAILEESFAGQPHWGWKDPRTTLTIPFWQDLLAGELKTVICVRNPLAVAASLKDGDQMPLTQALALWQFYTERALLDTSPEMRVIVFYEDFFTDCSATLAPVLELAGLPPLVPGSPRAEAVSKFVDSGLYHHRFTPADVASSPDVPEEIREFYALLHARSPLLNAFVQNRQRPDRDHQFQSQYRAYSLEREVNRLQTILDSPPHKLIHRFAGPARRLGPLHRAATQLLRAVAAH